MKEKVIVVGLNALTGIHGLRGSSIAMGGTPLFMSLNALTGIHGLRAAPYYRFF